MQAWAGSPVPGAGGGGGLQLRAEGLAGLAAGTRANARHPLRLGRPPPGQHQHGRHAQPRPAAGRRGVLRGPARHLADVHHDECGQPRDGRLPRHQRPFRQQRLGARARGRRTQWLRRTGGPGPAHLHRGLRRHRHPGRLLRGASPRGRHPLRGGAGRRPVHGGGGQGGRRLPPGPAPGRVDSRGAAGVAGDAGGRPAGRWPGPPQVRAAGLRQTRGHQQPGPHQAGPGGHRRRRGER